MTPALYDAQCAIRRRKESIYAVTYVSIICCWLLYVLWSMGLPEVRFYASCINVPGGDECTITMES